MIRNLLLFNRLKDTCKIDPNSTMAVNELASDEIITDMDFSPQK